MSNGEASPGVDRWIEHRRRYFDALAPERERWLHRNARYHELLAREYRFWIPPGRRVLEIGCGLGDLLTAVEPETGVGIDLSAEMIRRAELRHPGHRLRFMHAAVENMERAAEPFDAIILSDLLGDLYDIRAVFESLQDCCHARTRLVMNFHSRLWEPALSLASAVGLKASTPDEQNWVTREDVGGLLSLSGFEAVWQGSRILVPAGVPGLEPLLNRIVAPFWPFNHLCLSSFVVARPLRPPFADGVEPVVSVVVPCRNEAGNIQGAVERTPEMGAATELVFVEGGSTDSTLDSCYDVQRRHPDRRIRVLQQPGSGKGDAVRTGFDAATGDVLMILDADLTVPPEELPSFYEALVSGRAELVNGSRLVYGMEPRAMRFLNLLANKVFGYAFTWLLGQPVRDTLCGTKALLAADYRAIAAGRGYFGDIDPFGDFDLLFGAAKLGLRIRDLPIRYRERTYGSTNISRFRHGLLLVRMCWRALSRLRCR